MSILLLLAALVVCAAAWRPVGFADLPAGAPVSGEDPGGPDEGPADGPLATGEGPAAAAQAPPGDADERIVDDVLAEGAEPEGEASAAGDLPQPPQPPGTERAEDPAETLQKLGVDMGPLMQALEQQLGGQVPPEVVGTVAEWCKSLYLEHYTPAAEQLREVAEQQQSYYAWLSEFVQSPAYELAASLAEDPQRLAKARELNLLPPQMVTAGTPGLGQGREGAEATKVEDMDPETRALYQQVDSLRGQLTELTGRLSQQGEWQQRQDHSQAEYLAEQDQARAGALMQELNEGAKRQIGLDVYQHPQQLQRAWEHVFVNLQAMQARLSVARQGDGQAPREQLPNVAQMRQKVEHWFQEGLALSGLSKLAGQRKRQVATSVKPPGGAQPGGAAGDTDERIVDEALAKAGRS